MTALAPLRGLAILTLLLTTSCEKHDSEPVRRASPTTAVGIATIRGRAIFKGTPPVPRPIDNHACHPGAKPIADESILVAPGGGIQNVVVYLRETGPGMPPASQPTIDQVDCRYVPHVTAIQAGQKVVFKSSEPASVAHNVHVASLGLNLSVIGPGSLPPVKFDSPDFVNVRCDVHPWMSAWVAVMDTPYFAVTDAEGRFEIRNVPAGNYALAAWHERLPPMEQQVRVNTSEPSEVTLSYQAP